MTRWFRGAVRWAGMGVAAAVCAAGAAAQGLSYTGSPVDLGQVTLGTAANATLQFSVAAGSAVTIGSVAALTDGAAGQDFTVASTTCAGTLNGPATCTVTVNFTPKQIGTRHGAVVVTGSGGSATAFVRGVGLGSQLAYAPSEASALSTVAPLAPVYYAPSAVVYDGAGNLYMNDFLNGRVLLQTPAGTLSTVVALPQAMGSAMAINGAGRLYVSAPTLGTVYVLDGGVGPAVPLVFTGATLVSPTGLAVDGSGNLYVADAASNRVIRSAADGSGATVLPLTGLAFPLSGPHGLAVDANNFLYISDSGNNRIVKVNLATGAAAPLTITGSLLYNPYGVTTDAGGAIYIADTGNRRIVRVPPTGAASAVQLTNFAFSAPTAVVVTATGDLTVADNAEGVTRVVRGGAPGTLTFPTPTPVKTVDGADGPRFLTLQNVGNLALQLTIPTGTATNPSLTNPAFALAPDTTCPTLTSSSTAASGQIAVGAACTFAISFTPSVVGLNTGSLIVQNTPTGASVPLVQTVGLQGTGIPAVDTFAVMVTPTPTYAGILNTISVTVLNNGTVSTRYRGTATFTSSDAAAVFPGGTTYTFTAADAGVHTFVAPAGVIFNTPGTAAVTVTDGTTTGTSNVVTVGPRIVPVVTVSSSVNPAFVLQQTTLTATLSVPIGTPTGTVSFFDGTVPLGTATVTGGVAKVQASFLSAGPHSVKAVYNGDVVYNVSTSAVLTETVMDFTFSVTGASSATVFPGKTASYTFAVTPVGGTVFPGNITFAVAGLPAGATAAFAPSTVAAGSGAATVVMTVQTPLTLVELKKPREFGETAGGLVLSACVLPLMLGRKKRRGLAAGVWMVALAVGTMGLSGCLGDRASGYFGQPVKTFTLTVTASSGSLSHSTNVTLTVE